MAKSRQGARPGSTGTREDPEVAAYLAKLRHARKPELETLRKIVLGASPDITEGIKWNAPSFRTAEWFLTMDVHAKDRIRVVLHQGAKMKDAATRPDVPDPQGIVQWLSGNRGLVTFESAADVESKRDAFRAVVREWIRRL